MKWIGSKFREAQSFWYSKAGISWHISLFERMVQEKEVWKKKSDVIVSVVENGAPQDANTTLAILKSNLLVYSKSNPDVAAAILKSDNAGTCLDCISFKVQVYLIKSVKDKHKNAIHPM